MSNILWIILAEIYCSTVSAYSITGNYCWWKNTKLNEKILSRIYVPLDGCQEACRKEYKCGCWTYNKKTRECALKRWSTCDVWQDREMNYDFISGTKECGPNNFSKYLIDKTDNLKFLHLVYISYCNFLQKVRLGDLGNCIRPVH